MAVERPGYNPSVAANLKTMRTNQKFFEIPKDTRVRFRFLPATEDEGPIFTRVANHFNLKGEENNGIAVACLEEHGNEETGEECFVCQFGKALHKIGDKKLKDLAFKKMFKQYQWYSQVLVGEKGKEGLEYFGPMLLKLPITGVKAVNEIMANQEEDGEVVFCDSFNGHDLVIKRYSKTPWYTVDRAEGRSDLDDLYPKWAEKFMTNVYTEINQKVISFEEQKEAFIRNWKDELPLGELLEKFGL